MNIFIAVNTMATRAGPMATALGVLVEAIYLHTEASNDFEKEDKGFSDFIEDYPWVFSHTEAEASAQVEKAAQDWDQLCEDVAQDWDQLCEDVAQEIDDFLHGKEAYEEETE